MTLACASVLDARALSAFSPFLRLAASNSGSRSSAAQQPLLHLLARALLRRGLAPAVLARVGIELCLELAHALARGLQACRAGCRGAGTTPPRRWRARACRPAPRAQA
jgi:hypothetical protein